MTTDTDKKVNIYLNDTKEEIKASSYETYIIQQNTALQTRVSEMMLAEKDREVEDQEKEEEIDSLDKRMQQSKLVMKNYYLMNNTLFDIKGVLKKSIIKQQEDNSSVINTLRMRFRVIEIVMFSLIAYTFEYDLLAFLNLFMIVSLIMFQEYTSYMWGKGTSAFVLDSKKLKDKERDVTEMQGSVDYLSEYLDSM